MTTEEIKKIKLLLRSKDVTNQQLAFELLEGFRLQGVDFMPMLGKDVLNSAQKLRWVVERKWNFVLEHQKIWSLDLERWEGQPGLPGHILQMPALQKLRLAHFDWDGQLPELQDSKLKSLFIYGLYQLSTFPSGLLQLSQLNHLELSHENLTALAPSMEPLSKLQSLNLSFNRFEGIPEELYGLVKLQVLDLSNNNIRQISLKEPFKQITWLDLSNNNIDQLPLNFWHLFPNVEVVDLSNNQLGMNLPEAKKVATKLRKIRLVNNSGFKIKGRNKFDLTQDLHSSFPEGCAVNL